MCENCQDKGTIIKIDIVNGKQVLTYPYCTCIFGKYLEVQDKLEEIGVIVNNTGFYPYYLELVNAIKKVINEKRDI